MQYFGGKVSLQVVELFKVGNLVNSGPVKSLGFLLQ